MDKELVEKWVAALRSGKYEQGRGQLRSLDDRFCCLGVGADMVGCEWKRNDNQAGEQFVGYYAVDEGQGWFGSLPDTLRTKLGIHETQSDLISMNDHYGKTFTEIADWIENNVLKAVTA